MYDFKPIVPEKLRESTLCVTGYSGYVGSHLLEALHSAGIRPFLIPRPNTAAPETKNADSAIWREPAELAEQIAGLHDPVILNIAGHFVSRHEPGDIPALVSGNLKFPLQIFESLKLSGHGRIVNIGTSWEYTDKGEVVPANLYAQLKASNAQALQWFAQEAPIRAINLKLNDTYGGNDTRPKLMPLLKSCAADGQNAQLRTRDQKLNLLHITDCIEGLLASALRTADLLPHQVETAFLLGEETRTLGEIVAFLQDSIVPELKVSFEDHGAQSRSLRGVWENAPRLAGWHSRISLEQGLRDYFGAHS